VWGDTGIRYERLAKTRLNRKGEVSMEGIIASFLEQLKVGRKQTHKNLALYPLLSAYSIGLDYLLLDEALSENMIEVVEVSEGGSVPQLKVVNKSVSLVLILDKERPSLDEYVKDVHLIDSQVGAMFMINGQIAGMDAFGRPDTFSKVFKKLLESYALDAIDWYEPDKEHKVLKSEVTKFRKAAHSAKAEARPAIGLGTDFRLESKKITGFALALHDQILHLSVFAKTNGRNRETRTSRMERYTQKRRNRTT
jgi:hypothetical protein